MESNARITFLGTGTSIGVPAIGCGCPVCASDDPKNQRLRSSIHVETQETSFVVDTGPDFRQQCLREDIRHLDAVLFTHAHSDHVMGFDDLRRFTVGDDASIDVFATESCHRRLRDAFRYAFDGENRYFGYLKPVPRNIRGPFRVGDIDVTPLPVIHGKVETVGFLFRWPGGGRFAYVPDAKEIGEEARELIRGAEVLVLDALHPMEHPTHLSTGEAVELALDLEPGETWLTHFSCRSDYREIEPGLPEGIRMAWDGLVLEL